MLCGAGLQILDPEGEDDFLEADGAREQSHLGWAECFLYIQLAKSIAGV
jgi:hypothetical protein